MLVEVDIITLLKNKDAATFNYLYDKYAPALNGVILKCTSDQLIASYILRESFVSIWQKIEYYNSYNSTIFTWMLGITINQCNIILRSPKPTILLKLVPKDNSVVLSKNMVTNSSAQFG